MPARKWEDLSDEDSAEDFIALGKRMAWASWCRRCDTAISALTMGALAHRDDLEDYEWRECFDDDMTPRDTVVAALANMGFVAESSAS